MPKQDDADNVLNAQSYVDSENATYNKQSKQGSSDNRAHMDNAYPDKEGGVKQLKPQPPSCEGRQFADNAYDSHYYLDVRFDKWNNVIATDRTMHNSGAVGDAGESGDRQFSSNAVDLQSTGYGSNYGLNVIEHGQSAAFNQSERVSVDNSKADRGSDS